MAQMQPPKDKPRICFVALNCYNLLAGRSDLTHIGGAEVQQTYMAQWLVSQGYDVCFVTLDHGQSDAECHEGITVYKAYAPKQGLPVLRFFTPRWRGLVGALARANADIYYQRGAGVETGQIAQWCRRQGKRFIFGSASDSDCLPNLPFLHKRRDRLMYRYGLRRAQTVVAQTRTQQSLLSQHYGIQAQLLRSSGVDLGQAVAIEQKPNTALWIGRLSSEKRFEWLLDVARCLPDFHFTVVGSANRASAYASDLIQQAEASANIQLVGHVPKSQMVEYYNRAKFLLSTSPTEGFPNVFIEAWQLGVPVVTAFDPDGVVERSQLGWVVDSPTAYAKALQAASRDEMLLQAYSRRVRHYYQEQHSLENNMREFEKIIALALESGKPARSGCEPGVS